MEAWVAHDLALLDRPTAHGRRRAGVTRQLFLDDGERDDRRFLERDEIGLVVDDR